MKTEDELRSSTLDCLRKGVVFSVEHRDTDEPHVHIIVNRVHSKPEVLVYST